MWIELHWLQEVEEEMSAEVELPECTPERIEQLNSLLVRFICSAGLSFDTIESESFRYFSKC